MKQRFILFRRAGVYYSEDTVTRKQHSLRTKDEAEALTLLHSKNEAHRQPVLNLHIARAYLSAADPAFSQRTWQDVMEQMQTHGKDATQKRCGRAMKSSAFDRLRRIKITETPLTTSSLSSTVARSRLHYLRRLHNLALSSGWRP